MHRKILISAASALLLTGCSEDYAGFCEQVAYNDTSRYDWFEITDIIGYTSQKQPRSEVYVRFTGMRQTAATENRNVSCHFDLESGNMAAAEIYVDGRKLTDDIVAQYNASLAN